MNRRTENQINAMLRAINRRRWHVVLLVCLALVVTAGVVGVFHLPAIAKTYQVTQLTCAAVPPEGPAYADFFVHIHNDDCFDANGNLVCPLPEIRPHRHTADCYTTTRTLICAVLESDGHQHTEACYTPVRGDLICELSTEPVLDEEGNVLEEGHVHTDECFAWTEELTCGMEAGEGAHHHDDSCYQTVTTLTCEQPEILLYTHTDACYQKNEDGSIYVDEDGNTWLICGQLQVTEHVHGPECFTTYELDEWEVEETGTEQAIYTDDAPDAENTEGDESGFIFLFPEEEEEETETAAAEDENTEGEEPSSEEQETDPQTTEGSDEDAEGNDAEDAETSDSTEPNAGEENQEAAADEAEAGVEEPHTVVYTGTRGAEKGGMTVLAEIPEGALDENVQLILTDADEAAARKQILRVINENAAEGEEREISSMLLLDIGFAANGEPAALNGMDPIRVTLRAAAIRGMSAPRLFHLTGGTAREVEDVLFDTEAGTVVFTSTTFSPFAVVDLTGEDPAEEAAEETVGVSMPAQSFTGETDGVIVSVEAPEGAFPEGTTMVVSQVEMDDDTLSNVTEAVESNGEQKVITAQAIDISFFDADQNLIEPKLPIRVSMKSALVSESENVALVHLTEADSAETAENETPEAPVTPTAEVVTDVQVVENPDEDNEIQFESDAFSVYVIVGTVIEKNVLASDGKNYNVTVTYGTETGIPSDAELAVEEILPGDDGDTGTSSAYDEYVSKTENALGMEEGSAGYIWLFDIKIVNKDDHEIKYQPAEGTSVDVRIELADSESESLSVVHFADGAEEGDKIESSTESVNGGQAVCFEADSFSVYGIVDLDSADTASSVDELDGNSYYLSVDNGSNRYYFTNALNSVPRIVKTTTIDSAVRYYFEATVPDEQGNSFYIYTYDDDGNKKYANMTIASNKGVFSFDEEATTKYTVDIYTEGTEETPATFHIYNRTAANVYYTWHFNTDFEVARNSKGNGDKIILTKIGDNETAPSDPYGLDGQPLGIIWNVNDTSGSGMLASAGTLSVTVTLTDEDGKIIKDENNKNVTVKETINVLKNKSTTVRIDPVSRTDRVFVAQNSDITMWTFTCCGPAQYYITAVVNGQLKYVRFDDTDNHGNSDKGISLVDTPDERCKITVTEGTGTYSGKYKFSSNGRTLYNNNGNFYTVADSQNGSNVWMYFAEQSNLNDDDFVVYTAKKVSVSGTVNDDGTIDYDVKDGDQVVIYTRIWNETTLEYEYYTIDYDGMLVRAYMSGDNISWVGSKVNTMLWDFTEYHYLDDDGNETDVPNYYYELQNNYSGKYLAPQVTGDEFLADSPIGINLNGRRYNEYYSTILAWDDPYYDYAMLMVPENEYQLGSAPIALANDTTITRDFYFAIMTNDEESGELSTVETIDHTSFGISVKMINYPGGSQSTANGNYQNMIQTNVLGQTNKSGSVVYANLLKKNLSDNGYPDVALSGYTSHNLSELYSDCSAASETTVNHTFLASTYSETGYFEYDCTQNFAHLITSVDDVWYGMPMPDGGTYGIGDFVVYDQLGTTSETGDTRRHGQYFPYNDLAETVEVDEDGNLVITPAYSYSTSMYNTTDIKGNAITSLDPRYGEQLYQIPNSNTNKLAPNVDHYFGMEMDASFMQSESGLDAWGHDLIFEFSGDDDFWLYIDGKLVLDLGGIHSACDGSVNFRTGEVNVNGTKTNLRTLYRAAYLEENPDATEDEITAYLDGFFKDGGTVFKDYSGHTVTALMKCHQIAQIK